MAQAEGPCKKIKEACESAGFVKGDHKDGKGLWKDCISKIKAGATIPGVNVTPEDVNACKAKVAKKKAS